MVFYIAMHQARGYVNFQFSTVLPRSVLEAVINWHEGPIYILDTYIIDQIQVRGEIQAVKCLLNLSELLQYKYYVMDTTHSDVRSSECLS